MVSNTGNTIVMYVGTMYGGGTERVTYKLANQFVEMGYEVNLILNVKKGDYLPQISKEVNIIELNKLINKVPIVSKYLNKIDLLILLRILAFNKVIKKNNFNHVLCMGEWPNTIGMAWKKLLGKDTRIIISERNSKTFITSPESYKIKAITKYLTKKSIPFADAVIACSEDVLKALLPFYPAEKLCVINNPVDIDYIQEKASEPVSHPFFSESNKVLIAVGRLSPQKDYPTLLKAFVEAKKKIKNLKLLILGRGGEETFIRSFISDNKLESDIELLGFVDNPYKYIAKSDLFVHSALYEGFPNVIVEALACKTKVVTTNCDGVKEILDRCQHGSIVNRGNSLSLSIAIMNQICYNKNNHCNLDNYKTCSIARKYKSILFSETKL